MKAITIHLEESTLKIIEQRRGLKQRTVYIRDLINSHCLKGDSHEFSGDSQGTLMELSGLQNELEHRNTRISDLQAQIRTLEQQLGFLQLEFQKMTDRLMLPAGKSWWQFWK